MPTPNEPTISTPDKEFAETLGLGRPAKRGYTKWIVLAAILILAIGGGALGAWRFMRARVQEFETAEVKRGNLTATVTATGTLQPVNMVDVGAEISGRIEKVSVDFNQRVKKGDTLAEIDTRQLRAQVERSQASMEVAEAAVQTAEASLKEARQNAERSEELANAKLIAAQEVESARAVLSRAEAAVGSAKAQVTVARAGLNSDRTNLEKAVVRSPIDGVVISRRVEPGQTVASSFQTPLLFKLAENLSRMELHVNVDEADMGLVKEGQAATFTVDAHPNQKFPANISSLRNDPQTLQGVVSYEAVLTVDNSERLLRPGMTATASITTESRTNVILVPNAALRFTPPVKAQKTLVIKIVDPFERTSQVWKLAGEKPVAVPMQKGLTDGRFTEVLSGEIKPGDALLVDVKEKKK